MDNAIELRYAGWMLLISCITEDGKPRQTDHLSVTCKPYRGGGVTFQIYVRATSQLLSLVDVPDDPDDDILVQANTRLIWLLNSQQRTATLTFVESAPELMPARGFGAIAKMA